MHVHCGNLGRIGLGKRDSQALLCQLNKSSWFSSFPNSSWLNIKICKQCSDDKTGRRLKEEFSVLWLIWNQQGGSPSSWQHLDAKDLHVHNQNLQTIKATCRVIPTKYVSPTASQSRRHDFISIPPKSKIRIRLKELVEIKNSPFLQLLASGIIMPIF